MAQGGGGGVGGGGPRGGGQGEARRRPHQSPGVLHVQSLSEGTGTDTHHLLLAAHGSAPPCQRLAGLKLLRGRTPPARSRQTHPEGMDALTLYTHRW